ncbi:hypothetical protein J2128_002468 [Methanomicrobium sp. W14]|uniref:hypothetical protein n=1 Tax=Methanomicrobium sp. W14 TaxID=2817839 RepID=UPI001AE17DB1|nr:hypothetical protein [Methanomicrobium sp. W14]MBP2134502.1 hypothetical protein [Methanomicrobium sp. W14]
METRRISNTKFLISKYEEFTIWETENKRVYDDFNEICNLFEEFLVSNILTDKHYCEEVFDRIILVMENCNDLHFDNEFESVAYSLMHLLNRYHRAQLISRLLVREGLLPVREKSSDILEVGIGPGNMSLGVSDCYRSLKQFGEDKRIEKFINLDFSLDYIEFSCAFRKWLHHFNEHIYGKRNEHTRIPYHLGSFNDVYKVDFQSLKLKYQQDLIEKYMEEYGCSKGDAQKIVDEEVGGWKDAYRYNLVIFSNFITISEQVSRLDHQLDSICRALRNGGSILIVGGIGDNYIDIYKELIKKIQKIPYMKVDFNSAEDDPLCSFSYNDIYGNRIDKFYQNLIAHLDSLDLDSNSYLEFRKEITKLSDAKKTWKVIVFRKQLNKRFVD